MGATAYAVGLFAPSQGRSLGIVASPLSACVALKLARKRSVSLAFLGISLLSLAQGAVALIISREPRSACLWLRTSGLAPPCPLSRTLRRSSLCAVGLLQERGRGARLAYSHPSLPSSSPQPTPLSHPSINNRFLLHISDSVGDSVEGVVVAILRFVNSPTSRFLHAPAIG